tara:strand:- start:1932 stop:2123 length:192 start_codon:yes stop_codon:yes gene_type:complete
MKVTKRQLRRIIKEERAKLNEGALAQQDWFNLSDEIDTLVDKYLAMGYDKAAVIVALSQIIEG